MVLSKSDFLLFLKQPAWLWLKKHNPKMLPPVDDNLQAMFDAGFLFEAYAEKLFPDGLRLGFDGYQEYLNLPNRTREAILGGAKTIFQGRFEAGEVTCICDVVTFVDEQTVDLYEIKSSTQPKTLHEHDLAFQAIVLQESGYTVRNTFVVHVNRNFVRKGEVKPDEIAITSDITRNVMEKIKETRDDIQRALQVAKGTEMPNPTPAFSKHGATTEWIEIYKNLMEIKPGEGSIYDLYSPSAPLVLALEDMGIQNLLDIPENLGELSRKQAWQLKAAKADQVIADEEKLKKFLKGFEYPLYFLDYETLASVVPYFNGQRPYQQVPFQYSLHVIESPGAQMKHYMYLHEENSDPVRPLTESLRENIGDKGSIVVWYESFEMGCNEDMGKMYPEYAEFYRAINGRVVDLMKPFFNFWYVDKRFKGSASIKFVLPVLVPELSHKDLEISEGGAAQRLWMEAVLDSKRDAEKEKILKNLRDYCELDTLAMVRIYEYLIEYIGLEQKSKPVQIGLDLG
jgi:hypothetical protein